MNQRTIFSLIAVVALGYVGYILWSDHGAEWMAKSNPTPAPAEPAPAPVPHPAKPAPTVLPREGRLAPPGVYYMLERVSVVTDRGVKAVNAGEEVKLMQRKGGGVLRVTIDDRDFDVKETQVTNDLEVVRKLPKPVAAPR